MLEARNEETRKDAEALAQRLDGEQFIVIRAASDGGALYGSVSTRDVADAASRERSSGQAGLFGGDDHAEPELRLVEAKPWPRAEQKKRQGERGGRLARDS